MLAKGLDILPSGCSYLHASCDSHSACISQTGPCRVQLQAGPNAARSEMTDPKTGDLNVGFGLLAVVDPLLDPGLGIVQHGLDGHVRRP